MKPLLLAVILILIQAWAFAETSVWIAGDGDNAVYLGGTLHLLRSSDYPLPAEFEEAYEKSNMLYLETDVAVMNQPDVQQMMLSKMRYPEGKTLRQVLTREAYNALAAKLDAAGLPASRFDSFKPALAVLTFLALELQRLGISADGVDSYFYYKAARDRKPVGKLETLDDHLNFLATMGEGSESQFIVHSIRDFERMGPLLDQIIRAWRSGNNERLTSLLIAEFRRDYPSLYNNLLVQRNKNWLPKIESLFEQPGTEFVLVGAAHLFGDEGILNQLKQRGYRVRQL